MEGDNKPHSKSHVWTIERTPSLCLRYGLDVLPPELVDFVFAHTSYDKATISACALVSRSWRSLCIPHLFSSLTVIRHADITDLEHFLNANQHIAGCVRKLELNQLEPPNATVSCVTVAELCAKLPGLQIDRKSTRLNSSHSGESRMPSSA